MFLIVAYSRVCLAFLSLNYYIPRFSFYVSDRRLFILDEVGSTLTFMIVLVVLFSLFTYLISIVESNKKASLATWLCLLISLASVVVFLSSRLLLVYVGYELSLVPIILIIFLWGTYPERSVAAMAILMYTLFFSLPLIIFFGYL